MSRRKTTPDLGPDEGVTAGGQINFKANPDLWQRLLAVSEGLGLDMANLARMIVTENLPRYEDRVEENRRKLKREGQ